MTIEQWIMQTLTCDGLTRGRGVQESNLAKFILSMPFLINVIDCFREFCHVTCDTSEQHIDDTRNRDSRPSMIKRDNSDIEKIYNWFTDHLPFPISENISCISTGHQGNSSIDCYKAYPFGLERYKKVIGKTISEVKFKRKARVKTLDDFQARLKINKKSVTAKQL